MVSTRRHSGSSTIWTPGPLSRRGFLGLGGALGLGAGLAACGGGGGAATPRAEGDGGAGGYEGPAVELAFWNGFTGGDGPIMREMADTFSADQANIDVKMTTMEWADYYQKVPSAVTTGNGPDVGIMHVDSLATNAARGVIQPLDDVAEALGFQESDFAAEVWNAGMYDGARYGIPLDVHPLGMFYNKTVLEQAGLDPENPPQTADDYMAALAELKAAGIQGHWATPFQFTGAFQFQSLLWQFGGDLFNEDTTEATFNSDAGVEALTWLRSLVDQGYSPSDVGQDADSIAFQNGQAAFCWNGIWAMNSYAEVSGLEWGAAPLPQIGDQAGAWAGSHQFVIMKQRRPDENKLEAAKVFINEISQKSLEWAGGGQVPARKEVREGSDFAALEVQSTLAQQVDALRFPPPVAGVGDALAPMNEAVNLAVLGKTDPKAALDDAASQAAKILEENRQKYGG